MVLVLCLLVLLSSATPLPVPVPVSLRTLRTETIHSFDINKYPVLETVREVLATYASKRASYLPELGQLHMDQTCGERKPDGSRNNINILQQRWNGGRTIKDMESEAYRNFNTVYRDLVREVVGPLMGDGALVFQRAPGLRVSPPAPEALGQLHCDKDYHHQPSELNFWLPLTSTFGTPLQSYQHPSINFCVLACRE